MSKIISTMIEAIESAENAEEVFEKAVRETIMVSRKGRMMGYNVSQLAEALDKLQGKSWLRNDDQDIAKRHIPPKYWQKAVDRARSPWWWSRNPF
jgi:HEPN domain-containing protein